jgi:hypothetical protein
MSLASDFDDLEALTEKFVGASVESGENMTHCERFLFALQFVCLSFVIIGMILFILKVERIV